MSDGIIFELNDPQGRAITLTSNTWGHIKKEHPEVRGIQEVRETVKKPHYIIENTQRQQLVYIRRSVTSLSIRMNVIARLDDQSYQSGTIKTGYLSQADPKGQIIWVQST